LVSSEEKEESSKNEVKFEDMIEYLWKDLYESRRKLVYSRRTLLIDELLLAQKG